MNHQITPFIIVVIRNHQPTRPVGQPSLFHLGYIQRLQNLSSFTPRRSTQIDYFMMGLDIEEEGGDHGNGFLSRDIAGFTLTHEKVLEFSEGRVFADDFFADGDLPGQ